VAFADEIIHQTEVIMFSKQHYNFLADWLNTAALATTDDMAANLVASSLADRLGMDSPRFDRARFLKAAGCDRRRVDYQLRAAERLQAEQRLGRAA
jgi:hypothetical protein